jgi:hypothetical protein
LEQVEAVETATIDEARIQIHTNQSINQSNTKDDTFIDKPEEHSSTIDNEEAKIQNTDEARIQIHTQIIHQPTNQPTNQPTTAINHYTFRTSSCCLSSSRS